MSMLNLDEDVFQLAADQSHSHLSQYHTRVEFGARS